MIRVMTLMTAFAMPRFALLGATLTLAGPVGIGIK